MSEEPAPAVPASDNKLASGVRRAAEVAAVLMIGDGALGMIQAVRHAELWRPEVKLPGALVRPGRSGAYGLIKVAAGMAVIAGLRSARKRRAE